MGRVFRTRQPLQHRDKRAGANKHPPLDAIVRFVHHLLRYHNIIDAKQTPITPSATPRPTLAPVLSSGWPTVHGSGTELVNGNVNDETYVGFELGGAEDIVLADNLSGLVLLNIDDLLETGVALWMALVEGVTIRIVVDDVARDWLVRTVDDEVVEGGWIETSEDCVEIIAECCGDRREVPSLGACC